MIGYDATNTIGQSIAIREKIYLFTLSYFSFIYKSLPLFSFKFDSTEIIISSFSDKILEYFENYIIVTESNMQDKKEISREFIRKLEGLNIATNKKSLAEFWKIDGEQFVWISLEGDNTSKWFGPLTEENLFTIQNIEQQNQNTDLNLINFKIVQLYAALVQKNGAIQGSSIYEDKIPPSKFSQSGQYNKKALAKYYLAALQYYEPTFDFESADLNQVEEFGNLYLKQLFQENILTFIENAKKYAKENNYTLDYDSKWKYFAYAMLRSQYSANFLNIIQQPVSYPSRQNVIIPNQPEVSFFSEIQGLLFEEIDEIPTDSSIVTFVGLHTNKDLTLENNVITKEYWDDAPNILRYFVKNTSDTPEVTNAYTSTGLNSSISDKGSFTTIYTQVLVKFGKTLLFDAYPPIKQPDAEKNELSTFFEFSFQPNYEKITTKFPALKDLINKKSFDTLVNSYFLKLSKTETYIFMKNLLGGTDLLIGITEEEFSSLFDLQIALLYKMPKYLLQDASAFTTNFNYFDSTSFGTRSWYVDSGVWGSAASVLYNPLIKPEENKLEKNSKYINIRKKYALNRSLILGNAFDDFGIVIRTFNPQQTFLNDTLLNKVITIIDEAKTEEAKIIKDEFVKNLDYNPFDFSRVAGDFLAIEAAKLPQNLINDNIQLFSKPYSEFSKNLLDSLITNAEKVK